MASQEKLAPSLPETLPEDFFDWDGEASAAPSPDHSGEREIWEAALSFDETVKPHWQSADREPIPEPPVDRPRVSGSAPSAPVIAKPRRDFNDRKSEANPGVKPGSPWEQEAWEAALPLGKTAKSPRPSIEREAIFPPVANKPRVPFSGSSAPGIAKQQEPASALMDESPSRAPHKPAASPATNGVAVTPHGQNAAATQGIYNSPEFKTALRRDADEVIFGLFSPKNIEVLEEPKPARKKWMIVAPVSAGSVLLLLLCIMPLMHHGTKAATKPTIQPTPATSDTQPQTDAPKPPASGRSAQDRPATNSNQPTADDQPASDENASRPAAAQTRMMSGQLSAPATIPRQVAASEPPPASFGTGATDGLGGGSGNAGLFKGRTQSVINASRPIVISSGVATGMLIRKTEPVYPTIAKSARVSGTVVLHAIISKTGTITDLQVVSGPAMLRGAAVDAVRTWRYKPYRLNDEPTDVETTINVIFTIA